MKTGVPSARSSSVVSSLHSDQSFSGWGGRARRVPPMAKMAVMARAVRRVLGVLWGRFQRP